MTTPVKRMPFEEILVKKGLILEHEKDTLRETAKTSNQSIARIQRGISAPHMSEKRASCT